MATLEEVQAELNRRRAAPAPLATSGRVSPDLSAVTAELARRKSAAPVRSLAPVAAAPEPEPDFDQRQMIAQGRETLSEENIGRVLGLSGAVGLPAAAAFAAKGVPWAVRALATGAGSGAGDVGQQAGEVIRGERESISPAQVGIATGAGAVAQPVGELVGAAVPGLVKRVLHGGGGIRPASDAAGDTAEGMIRGGRAGVQQSIEDLERFGTSPSVAQATGRTALDGIESLVSKAPGGAGVFRKAVADTTAAVRQGVERHVAALTSGRAIGPETGGRAVRQGIKDYVSRTGTRSERLWQNFNRTMDPATPTPATNTLQAFGDLSRGVEGAPAISAELRNPAIVRMAESLAADMDQTGTIPYRALSQLRSRIGERLRNPSLTSDIGTREYKRLYAGLSEDLRTAARATGPKATQAFNRANTFTRETSRRIEDALEPLAKRDVPSKISNALFSGSKQGPEQLRTLLRSVTPDQQDMIVADILNRIGTANPSAQGSEAIEFSFETFLTNWARLRQAGTIDVLFKRGRNIAMGQDLDALARAATRVRETSQAFKNPPGSGAAAVAQASLFGGVGSAMSGLFQVPLSLIGAGAAFAGTAKLMTSPRFVRWLAQSTRLNPKSVPAHVAKLPGLALKEDPETQEAIVAYLEALQSM